MDDLINSGKRRELILEAHHKEAEGFDCSQCTGVCCTFERNKIHISPLEAIDILLFFDQKFETEKDWNDLILLLEENVTDFRLDKVLLDRSSFRFRRTYTCPFFSGKELGCQIHRDHKPYGCLAYGPNEKNIKKGENCERWIEVKKKRDQVYQEVEGELELKISSSLNLIDQRDSIPVMLLAILKNKRFINHSDFRAFLRGFKND